MAAKNKEKKRKQVADTNTVTNSSPSKKPKLIGSKPEKQKLIKPNNNKTKLVNKSKSGNQNDAPDTKRGRRLRAKELAEARKKKRKRHYNLEHELASMWEKMRRRNMSDEDRSKDISEALHKMKGKIPEIASSHVSSRVLQTCVKFCSKTERDAVYEELKPQLINFSCNTYAVHLVKKLLDSASTEQRQEFISIFRGHVAALLRHMVGSVVIEHAYASGNAAQKQELLNELYSTELQLFKDLALMKESRLVDVISKLKLQKASVLRHMTSVIQPILEKGIVDHSIIHRVLIEYFSIADKSSAAEGIQQLSGPLLVRMIHTKDGSRIGMLCVKYGSAKERKKIIKGMKDHVRKIAEDQHGSMVLACIVSTVDDTKLITKIVIRELQLVFKDLLFHQHGRRPLLQLLHPNCSRYFSPDDINAFNLSIPSLGATSLSAKSELEVESDTKSSKDEASSDEEDTVAKTTTAGAIESASFENANIIGGGKKDPFVRRQELLVGSGLAERLIDLCIENVGELIRSKYGKEVLYEIATGGAGGILHPSMDDKLDTLHKAIASLAAEPKSTIVSPVAEPNSDKSGQEHVLEHFHSSRTIRKLILDSSRFATTLWLKALKGNCGLWAQGHSSKVISAFLESSDAKISELVKKELQPLIETGILKVPENKQLEDL